MTFNPEEMALFQTRYEEGYELNDERYQCWLKTYHPEVRYKSNQDEGNRRLTYTSKPSLTDADPSTSTLIPSNVFPRSSFLSKVLTDQAPSIKYPNITPNPSSGARVLTSSDNLERITEGEKEGGDRQRKTEKKGGKKAKANPIAGRETAKTIRA